MKPFQTKAVQLVLVAVAFVLGYATLASAASSPHCRVSEKTSANGTAHLQWAVMAAPLVRTAEGVNGMPTGTELASADPDDDASIDSDDVGSDPMGDDADDGDDLDGGDF